MIIESKRMETNLTFFLQCFYWEMRQKSHKKHTHQNLCVFACVSMCVWVFSCMSVLYLPQVLHAAMYAIKMNAEVFCQSPRTRPCLMRYNPLEAGILLSLFPSSLAAVVVVTFFYFGFNCFAYVNQFINVKFNSIPLSLQFHLTFPIDIFHTN